MTDGTGLPRSLFGAQAGGETDARSMFEQMTGMNYEFAEVYNFNPFVLCVLHCAHMMPSRVKIMSLCFHCVKM